MWASRLSTKFPSFHSVSGHVTTPPIHRISPSNSNRVQHYRLAHKHEFQPMAPYYRYDYFSRSFSQKTSQSQPIPTASAQNKQRQDPDDDFMELGPDQLGAKGAKVTPLGLAIGSFVGLLMIGSVFYFMQEQTKTSRPYKVAMEMIRSNEELMEILGQPLEEPYYIKVERNGNYVGLRFNVSGPNAAAKIAFYGHFNIRIVKDLQLKATVMKDGKEVIFRISE